MQNWLAIETPETSSLFSTLRLFRRLRYLSITRGDLEEELEVEVDIVRSEGVGHPNRDLLEADHDFPDLEQNAERVSDQGECAKNI